MKIRPYRPADRASVIRLWRDCNLLNPKNDPAKDILRKLKVKPGWFLIGEEDGKVVASVMAGYEGHRGWLNYVAVSPALRGKGHGRRMVERAEAVLKKAGCPKVNLQVRKGNEAVLGFYRELGYVEDEVVSMGKRFVDDSKKPRKASKA